MALNIVESLLASIASAQRFEVPFVHFRAQDLFPEAVSAALAGLPIAPGSPALGKREGSKNRVYIDPAKRELSAVLGATAAAFQSPEIACALGRLCGASFEGTYVRLEYAVDVDGFWLEPHTDLGVKKFTGLIPLSGGSGAAGSLGTDLYHSPDEHFSRAPFAPNSGLLFVPGLATWHGFEPRAIEGLRKSLIVNYVGPEWQSREQLAFPGEPIPVQR